MAGAAAISAKLQETLSVPLKYLLVEPIVSILAVSSFVAVAAFPLVFWLPAVLTPGKLIFADPSKLTPPIVLAVASLSLVPAPING